MSSSFTILNALPIIMVATKKTSKPWEPSPYYSSSVTSEPDKPPMPMPRPAGNSSEPRQRRTLLSTVMLLAIIVTTTCLLRTGVARDMRT